MFGHSSGREEEAIKSLCILALASIAASCVSIDERYHLRATDGNHTNYYRVKIDGWTWWSASQYASGLFDAEAVDSLFGELKGKTVRVDGVNLAGHEPRTAPAKDDSSNAPEGVEGRARTASSSASEKEKAPEPDDGPEPEAEPKLTSLDGAPIKGKKLVLFLSTNADALVNQISAIASKNTIQNTLTAMLVSSEIEELESARLSAGRAVDDARILAASLENIAGRLEPTSSQQAVQDLLLEALQEIARNTGASGADTIKDPATAIAWLRDNPQAFRSSGGPR